MDEKEAKRASIEAKKPQKNDANNGAETESELRSTVRLSLAQALEKQIEQAEKYLGSMPDLSFNVTKVLSVWPHKHVNRILKLTNTGIANIKGDDPSCLPTSFYGYERVIKVVLTNMKTIVIEYKSSKHPYVYKSPVAMQIMQEIHTRMKLIESTEKKKRRFHLVRKFIYSWADDSAEASAVMSRFAAPKRLQMAGSLRNHSNQSLSDDKQSSSVSESATNSDSDTSSLSTSSDVSSPTALSYIGSVATNVTLQALDVTNDHPLEFAESTESSTKLTDSSDDEDNNNDITEGEKSENLSTLSATNNVSASSEHSTAQAPAFSSSLVSGMHRQTISRGDSNNGKRTGGRPPAKSYRMLPRPSDAVPLQFKQQAPDTEPKADENNNDDDDNDNDDDENSDSDSNTSDSDDDKNVVYETMEVGAVSLRKKTVVFSASLDDVPSPLRSRTDTMNTYRSKKLTALLGTSELDRLEAAINQIILDDKTSEARAVKHFFDNFSVYEKNPHTVALNTRSFIDQLKFVLLQHQPYRKKIFEKIVISAKNKESLEMHVELCLQRVILLNHSIAEKIKHHIQKGSKQADVIITKNMSILKKKSQEEMGIPRKFVSRTNWQIAVDELNELSSSLLPSVKLQIILNCIKAIIDSIEFEMGSSEESSKLAADDLLPIFIYVLVHTNLEDLETQNTYMWSLSAPEELTGERGYYLTMFGSAVEYIKSYSPDQGTA